MMPAVMPYIEHYHRIPAEIPDPDPTAMFLSELARARANAAWRWFAVYNPLNMWVTTPPEFEEECSEVTLEAAGRWEVQRMFLWHLGLSERAEAMPLCEVRL